MKINALIELSPDQIKDIATKYNSELVNLEQTTFSIAKASRILGISVSTIRRRIEDGSISTSLMGKSPRITQDEINNYKNLKP